MAPFTTSVVRFWRHFSSSADVGTWHVRICASLAIFVPTAPRAVLHVLRFGPPRAPRCPDRRRSSVQPAAGPLRRRRAASRCVCHAPVAPSLRSPTFSGAGLHQPPAEAWTRCVWAPLRPRWVRILSLVRVCALLTPAQSSSSVEDVLSPSPLQQAPPPPGAAQPDATAHARPAPARTATAVLSGACPGCKRLSAPFCSPNPARLFCELSPPPSPGVRISPKKLNLVAALVRGLSVEEALAQLSLVPKVGARVTEKVLSSASANAVHNHGLDAARLRVRTAVVSKGSFLRRIKFHARGKTVRTACAQCQGAPFIDAMTWRAGCDAPPEGALEHRAGRGASWRGQTLVKEGGGKGETADASLDAPQGAQTRQGEARCCHGCWPASSCVVA